MSFLIRKDKKIKKSSESILTFPVPGGPSKSKPVGALAPTRLYFSGFRNVSTSSITSCLASSMPWMSSNEGNFTFPLFFLAIFPGPLDGDEDRLNMDHKNIIAAGTSPQPEVSLSTFALLAWKATLFFRMN
jgi:hypothetical protein